MSCILCLIKIASLIIIYNFLFIFCLNVNLFIIICVLLECGYMLVLMLVRFAYIGICNIFIFILNWRIILIFILVFLYICESVFLVMLVMIIFFHIFRSPIFIISRELWGLRCFNSWIEGGAPRIQSILIFSRTVSKVIFIKIILILTACTLCDVPIQSVILLMSFLCLLFVSLFIIIILTHLYRILSVSCQISIQCKG